ncbi:MAG: hypothetical protein ACI9CZ_001502, partial [Flavobacterium sp.]
EINGLTFNNVINNINATTTKNKVRNNTIGLF